MHGVWRDDKERHSLWEARPFCQFDGTSSIRITSTNQRHCRLLNAGETAGAKPRLIHRGSMGAVRLEVSLEKLSRPTIGRKSLVDHPVRTTPFAPRAAVSRGQHDIAVGDRAVTLRLKSSACSSSAKAPSPSVDGVPPWASCGTVLSRRLAAVLSPRRARLDLVELGSDGDRF
jgi:hypothetical protein